MININGKVYAGNSVQISGGNILIDGKPAEGYPEAKQINITVSGNIERLECDMGRVYVTGDVGDIQTQSGDVNATGDIRGSVSTMSGDVKCKGAISGSVKTMSGDISHN